ncbi:Uncharacterised protein [Corynebacterium matruchotii]|nr:Uncharacterised protein [Corynebacterium matruchotii]
MISVTCSTTTWELPPRARRIRTTTLVRRVTRGTISACAENTPPGCSSGSGVRNYLRVRGEYTPSTPTPQANEELPPRARRILSYDSPRCLYIGTTSACAENTGRGGASSPQYQNYLRVRGEYKQVRSSGRWKMELPPRARRIPQRASSCQALRGTTSACAENTTGGPGRTKFRRNYLRVRGEYPWLNHGQTTAQELPPRARRIHSGGVEAA